MNNRKKAADEKYRRMFYELGLDKDWIYLGFEKKDCLWFKCKKCGTEAPRGSDVFKGKQAKLLCRSCGNGTILYSPFVDEVLLYYQDGHSVKDTAQTFNVTVSKLNDWIKLRKVSNGRTFEQGARESNELRAAEAVCSKKTIRNSSYYRIAKLHGAPAEIGITLSKLIKRDGLTCAICGIQCIYGGNYLADLYPTMDHIIPLSKGGGHTWNNVQVAHRRCNISKRNLIGKEWNNAG